MSAIALVEELLASAHARGSSDIHLDPQKEKLVVRFRVDGELADAHEVPSTLHGELIARVKILAGLRTDEHQAAQDGRFVFGGRSGQIDVRVSIAPTYYGENAVLRLLAPREPGPLESLGFSTAHADLIKTALARPHGMILVTGPTGSGKTSTLYALIALLNRREVNILTIEDPVEYSIPGINQIQANARTGLTFGNGLRSMLRQDPDVIMVGEIRDIETAGMATNVALTGHLLLSTLHTNDAPTAIPRLLDMKVEPYLLASTVSLVIAQRLVRTICADCRERRELTSAERESLAHVFSPEGLPDEAASFRGRGCESCAGTGYRGRTGIFEVLAMTPELREAVLRKASLDELRELSAAAGMLPMHRDGFGKAWKGVTTIEEVVRMRHA
ncbi:MAG: GspE/PulE family protein [bacterium]